jgi:hypothetical protein
MTLESVDELECNCKPLSTADALCLARSQFRLLELRARRGIAITAEDVLRVAEFLRSIVERAA